MDRLRFSLANLATPVPEQLKSLRAYLARLKPGLSLKLLVVVVAISLLGILASSLFLTLSLQNRLVQQVEASATHLNQMLQTSLEHAMLTHESGTVSEIIQQVSGEMEGEKIWILDPEGVVRESSWPAEVGAALTYNAPECQVCHLEGTKQAASRMAILSLAGRQERVLLYANPIVNQPACSGCHDQQTKTLGVLITQTSLADLSSQKREIFLPVGLAALLTFGFLVGLMVPALRKVIISPIRELSKGVAEIGAENLEYQVRVSSQDELGQLAKAYDMMRTQLKTSRQAMLQHSQELALLYEVALITSQLLKIEQILNRALEAVINQLELDSGVIYLYDRARQRFETLCSQGLSRQQLQSIDQRRRRPGGDLTHDVALGGKVFFVPDMSEDPHFDGLWENNQRRSYVNVPLKSHGRAVGTLELISRQGHPLTGRLVDTLVVVGNQIGIAIENTSLLSETERSAREALTLYQLGTQVSASLELDQVLEAVAKSAHEVLPGDIGMVALLDQPNQELVIQAIAGTQLETWKGMRIPMQESGVPAWNRALVWDELPEDLSPGLAQALLSEQIQSLLAVPLLRGEQSHGIVVVLMRTRHSFIEEEVRLLTRLAQQVVIAIENARLYQQVRYLAVLEERDRLAREMHDELAQSLGYLNLKASLTSDLLSDGKVDEAQASLREMKQIARQAYTDTRESIFNLRNTTWSSADLLSMLRAYLAEYSLHYGLEARLEVGQADQVDFPSEVALQLNRIIQEALTNIRKHAGARHAWVRFERQGDLTRIVIEDDGSGFDLQATQAGGKERYGLQIMRERAESVGGSVEFNPRVGRGTRVIIRIPAQTNP